MEKILTFDGTNAALRAEDILKAEGIPVRIMSRPNSLGAECGFCVRLDPETWLLGLRRLLGRVTIRGVYDMFLDPESRYVYKEIPLAVWENLIRESKSKG
ncbi:MAG: DUF3343 domain-containing protein [Deltaproteobacteria bacterium]|jgi:hypothetical protein|nr:DUF3343 domain-containing protein [Deltaproteobacteria bacterium]